MKNNKKMSKGITLIALVVTIIVLLILAGISMQMLTGNNGIIERTGQAKDSTENTSIKEQLQIIVFGCYDDTAKLNLEKLKNDFEGIGEKIVGNEFPVTATISGKKYIIESNGNVKEINSNIITIPELQENASTFFGYDVINYAETLPENLRDTKWQLFYAGAIEGESEQKIYLISKEAVKNTVLPAKNGKKPIAVEGSDYFAFFGNNSSDGIIPKYTNLLNVSNMQQYIKEYFSQYSDRKSNNTRCTAYMLDTGIWNSFATSTQNYAEWAIGGPTIELLITTYNKYAGTKYEYRVASQNGYQIRKNSTDDFSNGVGNALVEGSPYIQLNISDKEDFYWIASPFNAQANMMFCGNEAGSIGGASTNIKSGVFRPVVLLKSNFKLEKVKDLENKDALKIIAEY